MTWTDADKQLENTIDEALQRYSKEELTEGEVITDWIIVFTRQKIDDQGEVTWANSFHSTHDGNPNAHVGMLGWGEATLGEMMVGSLDDDE